MAIQYLTGDPFLTQMQTLVLGYNARARIENTPVANVLHQRYPAAFAAYSKLCRHERIRAGDLWVWHESVPKLAIMVVRESSVGATRPRFVDAAMLRLTRDYHLDGITSAAIAPLGRELETDSICEALELLLPLARMPVVVYREYIPGVQADEPGPKR